jgi:hypothetical protein
MTVVLILTHFLAVGLGMVVCRFVFDHATHHLLKDCPVTEPTHADQPKRKRTALPTPVVVLVASILVLVIAIQSYFFQKAEAGRRDADRARTAKVEAESACFQVWADDMRDAVTLARSFTKDLELALERRNEAVDQIVLDVVAGQAIPEGQEPPPAVLTDFRKDLQEFVEARANLVQVKKTVDQDRLENPFPTLDQNCQEGRDAVKEAAK